MKEKILCMAMLFFFTLAGLGQGYLHADGKRIVDGNGENVILRGIGTGNWMIQEGYMMQTSGVAGAQHEIEQKLMETMGQVKTDSFYSAWLHSHFTRTDVDSMASWGFNSVRVAMHYKWFTPPIEEEPVPGEQTWLNTGFDLIDSLLDWCSDNEIYLILDMHGAPGGQGYETNISDYDPSKPSLWESTENKDKLVALWQKLAARYSEEPWMGGYDLINETNWTFPEGNNSQMKALYRRITDSIRTVDQNHMIIIEGNWFANDFSGLTPPWDSNMAYSFHKYWTFNNPGSLDWVTSLRDSQNVPIWLGESGENSNTWFTNLITLCEEQNIGWSWWPVKKPGINNVLQVDVNDDYEQLVENWKGNGPNLSEEQAFQAVLTFANNHRIENCHFRKDVVDAMIRQPQTLETLPFTKRRVNDIIFASEYDLGRNGYAYFDLDTANYHGDMDGEYIDWNKGWAFRNDGVDIENCTDAISNGYNVGWTNTGEWMAYTVVSDSLAAYSLDIRSAAGGSGSKIRVEVNGVNATGTIQLPGTGGWQTWSTSLVEDVIIPEGKVQLKLFLESAGSNLNYIRLHSPKDVTSVSFSYLSAETAELEDKVLISLNKSVSNTGTLSVTDFTLIQGGEEVAIENVSISEEDSRVLVLMASAPLFFGKTIEVSYTGNDILHNAEVLPPFDSKQVVNQMARHFSIPGRIQAEDFYFNNGLVLESCEDAGGGENTGYANVGDYLDYIIYLEEAGDFNMNFRIATEMTGARLSIQADYGEGFQTVQTATFARTGGWQIWTTQTVPVHFEPGKFFLRLLVTGAEHNLNWFEFTESVGTFRAEAKDSFTLYPNPASGYTTLEANETVLPALIQIRDISGRLCHAYVMSTPVLTIDIEDFPEGLYFVHFGSEGLSQSRKLIVN